jgi:enediyne polyketide synthase
VRVFRPHLYARSAPPATAGGPARWQLVGAYANTLRDTFPDAGGAPPDACLLALPPGLADVPVDDIVTALQSAAAAERPLMVLHHGGVGAAVGRSLAAETGVPVLVVETAAGREGVRLAAAEAAGSWSGYREVVYREDGVRTVPGWTAIPRPTGGFR